jgi:hypothetical protein
MILDFYLSSIPHNPTHQQILVVFFVVVIAVKQVFPESVQNLTTSSPTFYPKSPSPRASLDSTVTFHPTLFFSKAATRP